MRSDITSITGFSFVEVVVALCMVGALASIAIPYYCDYLADAREATCASQRRTIETAEAACALSHGAPCLSMDKLVTEHYLSSHLACPLHGEYVWVTTNLADPHYPQLGCSVHFWPATQ